MVAVGADDKMLRAVVLPVHLLPVATQLGMEETVDHTEVARLVT